MDPEDQKQKVTYKLDPAIKARFEAAVPAGRRGKVVESLIVKYLDEWFPASNLPAANAAPSDSLAKE